jgi:hypothetical protein
MFRGVLLLIAVSGLILGCGILFLFSCLIGEQFLLNVSNLHHALLVLLRSFCGFIFVCVFTRFIHVCLGHRMSCSCLHGLVVFGAFGVVFVCLQVGCE